MRYKAIITDVDRTLIASNDSPPSPPVRSAILSIKDNAHFGLATSKPFNQVKQICEYLDLSGPSIVSGGAQIVDVSTGKYYEEYIIEKKILYEICETLINFEEKVNFWIQDNGVDYEFNKEYIPDKPFVIVTNKIPLDTANRIINTFSHIPNVFITKTPTYNPELIDVHFSNVKATKQYGVIAVARILGIAPSEIIGVGEGDNDFPLLMACGLKVAMGNAVPEIKEIADYVTKSVEEDGLAEVIKKYIIDTNK